MEKLELRRGAAVPRVAVLSSMSLYLFIEDPDYFLVEPLLTAKEKRTNRKDGAKLLREDDKFRWDALIESDFLAGEQSVVALRFTSGSVQLRFGCDFGLALFKRHLRALLPSGASQWRREFGGAMPGEREAKAKARAGGEGEGADAAAEEEEGEEDEEGEEGEEDEEEEEEEAEEGAT